MVTATKLQEKILSFNSAVGKVMQDLQDGKYVNKRMLSLHHGKTISGEKWRANGKKISPQNMTFLFRTNKNRSDLMEEISDNIPYRSKWISGRLSNLGHLEFNVSYVPEQGKGNKIITFHIVVKYKDKNAFRSLPYTNPLLEESNWKKQFPNRGPDTSIEHEILKKINDHIYSHGNEKEVDITLEGQSYFNIIGFIPGPSGAHADFVGIDKGMKEVCFISHKDGTTAKHFQQYSGISSQAGDSIHNANETEKFREVIASKKEQDFNNQSFSQDIRDTDLKVRSVLGPEWNSGGKTGVNSCSHFMQGNVSIRRTESQRSLKGKATLMIKFNSKNIHVNDINSLIRSSTYTPTLGARKTNENRSVTFGTTEVRNVRGGIFSSAYIKERNTNIELPIDE